MRAHLARSTFAAVALAVAASLCGCADMKMVGQFMFAPHLRDCEGFDLPLTTFVGPSRKELRARILAHNVDDDLPFVVETNADSLVLVGFTPLGTKSFTLVRNGDDVKVESMVGPTLPVPPRNVMEDVLAMSAPSTCAATPDGVATATFGVWQVSDNCTTGRPVLRHIARSDAKPGTEPEVEVEYLDDAIVVRQRRCHYNARYVLQASAPVPAPEPGVSDEAEESNPPQ